MSTPLTQPQIDLLKAFSQSCRRSILSMVTNAQSGHPGGSLGCIDYLSLLYTQVISQTGEPVIVSNGHISPAVYSVLGEMGYVSKEQAIRGFRKIGQPFEGHVTRHVAGVWYGTGPLGCGISAASGFALAQKLLRQTSQHVYALVGDGESQEGQVYEMMNFAHKYKLNNFIVFLDYNHVQLSDGLEKIMPLTPKAQWEAAGWHIIEVDGHNFQDMWRGLNEAHAVTDKPILLLAHTVMGKGVGFMEQAGLEHKADWHGKAPKENQAAPALAELKLSSEEETLLENFRKTQIKWTPEQPNFPSLLSQVEVKNGTPVEYPIDQLTDCRTAYGKALLDLAKHNEQVVALTADLADSVKTNYVKEEIPERHIECGIAEQHMVSCSGGLSLAGFIPFCSTFGAFMTSRAKDQARVNDINQANVKMVATHCGLSVGEDGPTHQAIDDMGSMLGLFNTMVIEPADANHCDRIIRYIASHYGNFYVRMGRHKLPILVKEDGTALFGKDYMYEYGRCDVLRSGSDITLVASGSVASEALKAVDELQTQKDAPSVELIIVSSLKKFDETLFTSIKKTKRVITVEDHGTRSGVGSQLARELILRNIAVEKFEMMGVEEYQLSGDVLELYDAAGISARHIVHALLTGSSAVLSSFGIH